MPIVTKKEVLEWMQWRNACQPAIDQVKRYRGNPGKLWPRVSGNARGWVLSRIFLSDGLTLVHTDAAWSAWLNRALYGRHTPWPKVARWIKKDLASRKKRKTL